jgi:hypothetical protein
MIALYLLGKVIVMGGHLLVVHGVYWIDIIRVLLLRSFQRTVGAFIQGLRSQNKTAVPSRYARAVRRSLRAQLFT